jgi:hypothetical protein
MKTKSMVVGTSSSTQNLHANHRTKLQTKYVIQEEDDFLAPSHHHQSVQISNTGGLISGKAAPGSSKYKKSYEISKF